MIYTCVRCGKQFQAKHKTAVCENCHTAVCIVCGREFVLQTPWTQKTCSRECRSKYIKESGIGKERTKRSMQTKLDKYGSVSGPFQTYKKICKYCGKEFETTSIRQIYCNDLHYGPCPNCGQPSLIRDFSIGPQACSEECRQALIKKTTLERYGAECIFETDDQKEKSKQTMLENYGVEHYIQSEEGKAKFRQTMLDRYGVDHPAHSEEISDRKRKTNVARYGVEYPLQNEVVKEKAKETVDRNYGGFGFSSPLLSERIRQTNLTKYNEEIPMHVSSIRDKFRETCLLRYGSSNFKGSREDLRRTLSDPSKVEFFLQFRSDPESFIKSNFEARPTILQISKLVGCDPTTVSYYVLNHDVKHLVECKKSTMESEVLEFLKLHVDESKIHINDRRQITPYELDFYLPDYNVAIECNPTYTHNSSKGTFHDESLVVPYDYHMNKTQLCENKNIQLFHIFGYQWTLKSDIIKSMIINSIKQTPYSYYARKLEIREVSDSESKKFLNENHLLGYTSSKVRYGLYAQNKLVCLMTFSRKRSMMGHQSKDTSEDWELTRFCNLKYTRCVGGASRLFKHFLKLNNPSTVVSFSDRSNTSGGLYSNLGFRFDSITDPSYVWVDSNTDSYYHRVKCQKSNLRKLFNDDTIDIENQTESQIMESHGFVKVYNSGLIKWMWRSFNI